MSKIGSVASFLLFIVTGLAAIIVGSFMLRGTMHMWDKNSKKHLDDDE